MFWSSLKWEALSAIATRFYCSIISLRVGLRPPMFSLRVCLWDEWHLKKNSNPKEEAIADRSRLPIKVCLAIANSILTIDNLYSNIRTFRCLARFRPSWFPNYKHLKGRDMWYTFLPLSDYSSRWCLQYM